MESTATKLRHSPFHVLIPAAGKGSRLGGEVPKQYQKINGKAILRHTIEKFMHCPGFKSLRVIIQPEHRSLYDIAVKGLDLPPAIQGGASRSGSVINGLMSFSNIKDKDIILIHDAVRPLVKQTEILDIVESLQTNQAATLGIPVTDTLRRLDKSSNKVIDRKGLWSIQTPQGFHFKVILDAHKNADKDMLFTDDTSLISAMGLNVDIVKGNSQNFKITTYDDLEIARSIISSQYITETRTAMGYDVHAFELEGDKIRLCGVDIPSQHCLKGHSDADVALHAITDALLGTICAGDIGSHFPPSDSQWKNADSAIFLEHAVALINDQSGKILHIDVTIICESPKIAPYRNAMKKRVAQICNISENRISIKATTTVRLGFTGRDEGMAAQALATISMPIG